MNTTTNIIWLQNNQDEPIPNELHSYIALFTSEDVCYQFISSLPNNLHGLTLVVTDSTILIDRLIKLKPISTIYILSSTTKPHIKHSSKIHGIFYDRQSLINQIISDLNRIKSLPPGFLNGIIAPFQGFYFILIHPSTWTRALIPAFIFTILLFTFSIPSIWGMYLLTNHLIQQYPSRWIHYSLWLLRIILYIVAIFLSLILAFITAQPLSAPALESLVRTQEHYLKYPNRPEESFCSSVWRSIRVAIVSIITALCIFIILTIMEFFFPPFIIITIPLKFIVTGFILAYDIIDYPLSLHLFGVRERTPWFKHYIWATVGFGLSMEIIFLIPGSFFLLLPAGVCGATILVVAAERAEIDRPLLIIDDLNRRNKMTTRSSSGARTRNASPSNSNALNVSRAEEKEQLETLNNRLAVYIDTVRRLEHDNKELKSIISSYTDTYELQTSKVKQLYERELEDSKKLIEELAREKSRLEIDAEKANAEAQDALTKLARKERELRSAEARIKQLETEIADLKARNEALVFDNNRKTDDNVTLRGHNGDLEKQVATLKRQLEAETLLRIDLENKNKTLREELQFNQQVHDTAVDEIRRQKRVELKTYDDGLRQQYDDRLLHELQQLRVQTDQELQSIRDDVAAQYEQKIDDLKNTIRRNADQFGNYRTDVVSYRERIDDLTKNRDALNDKVLFLEQRCRDLEERLHRAQQRQDELLSEREDELQRLKQQIEQMQIDYQNLLDIKIGLDREIATYRKLLESEEERLNISGSSSRSENLYSDNTGITTTSSRLYETSSYPSRKRLRYEPDERLSSIHSHLLDGINIIDDDSSHPKFVKLVNNSNQEINLFGWLLKRKVGTQSYEYKFPRGMILKAGATTTIWSSDVNDISVDPPTNLKLRTTKWFTTGNETKKTILEDADGRVVAEKTVTIK
ncbi:unnamed protein product [Rotaria sp. Silwood1]|nr:unnamed protein product [Rotaria sp. Silwood1]CAF4804515.1 unnamed protein product [Rotaria sp. Silwood1]